MTLANSLAALEDKSHIADIRGGGGTSRETNHNAALASVHATCEDKLLVRPNGV